MKIAYYLTIHKCKFIILSQLCKFINYYMVKIDNNKVSSSWKDVILLRLCEYFVRIQKIRVIKKLLSSVGLDSTTREGRRPNLISGESQSGSNFYSTFVAEKTKRTSEFQPSIN